MSWLNRAIKNFGYLKEELANVTCSSADSIIENCAVVDDFIESYLNNLN